jgi:hypothetical protein
MSELAEAGTNVSANALDIEPDPRCPELMRSYVRVCALSQLAKNSFH